MRISNSPRAKIAVVLLPLFVVSMVVAVTTHAEAAFFVAMVLGVALSALTIVSRVYALMSIAMPHPAEDEAEAARILKGR